MSLALIALLHIHVPYLAEFRLSINQVNPFYLSKLSEIFLCNPFKLPCQQIVIKQKMFSLLAVLKQVHVPAELAVEGCS